MSETGGLVCIIAALARDRVIGVHNTLPWHLPEDLQHFKRLTMGHHIIMGRKTFESIGRPLPGRRTVIVTRDTGYRQPGCVIAATPEQAVRLCASDDQVFFVGGAQIYAQALPMARRLYLTEIDASYPGDAWFPDIDRGDWTEVSRESHVSANGLGYAFVVLDRARQDLRA